MSRYSIEDMLDERGLRARLPIGWIGAAFYFHTTIGSTNMEAIQLAETGASHGTLVVAESQTAGRGRGKRRWITLAGTSLAFSLILRPSHLGADQWLRIIGLGAVSLAKTFNGIGLEAEIKWPNDVLVKGKKVAGILVNSTWIGEQIDYSVLGIGVNITPSAIPENAGFDFPAISLEEALGESIEREDLLLAILSNLEMQYHHVDTQEFIKDWQSRLAYLDQQVVTTKAGERVTGKQIGLTPKGELKLIDTQNRELVLDYGEVSLRPMSMDEASEGGECLASH